MENTEGGESNGLNRKFFFEMMEGTSQPIINPFGNLRLGVKHIFLFA
jgi:hypothetical protein